MSSWRTIPKVRDGLRLIGRSWFASRTVARITGSSVFANLVALAFAIFAVGPVNANGLRNVDVVVYGATPSGIMAAVAARRQGRSVLVVEASGHIGGMVTGGIGSTDTGTPELVGGLASEFFSEVHRRGLARRTTKHVVQFRGTTIPWYEPRPWDLEAHIAAGVMRDMIRKDNIDVMTGHGIKRVTSRDGKIQQILLSSRTRIRGKVFIDASYEGDLLALSGVPFTHGRESAAKYGESLAGIRSPHYIKDYTEAEYATPTKTYMHHGQFGAPLRARRNGKLLPGVEAGPLGIVGSADSRLQAFCFRLSVTQDKRLKRDWWKPKNYDPEQYQVLLDYVLAHPGITFTRLIHVSPVPGGKWDLNASGPFSTDFVGGNRGFLELTPSGRARMVEAHKAYQQGFLWFLAHDPRLPAQLREEVTSWGPSRDEWVDNDNWPPQLYIREARRMIGSYVMTQMDLTERKVQVDSIGMGSFIMDSHWVRRYEDDDGTIKVEGHLDESVRLEKAPYEISYRAIIPKREHAENLIVPVALSATHVAIGSIRMEPVYMILGQAAGTAAAIALEDKVPVQKINIRTLQSRLIAEGQILHKTQARTGT
ncbi:FAD-dependent oxidoreductase [Sphingomonas sp. M1-B02]|uniref:FAD-dependent oxidoreductase n=1 Tax=Sphingomonas sp. M1-B02 TaxID=3114300 RepID=UPI00223EDB37|nr:FAD-dependent oxidoreductase [Sphingomonas sp. S6-11]UZK67982.1 FAD-dependent oxidoreductase [Sphingomonas sp. S6-11]